MSHNTTVAGEPSAVPADPTSPAPAPAVRPIDIVAGYARQAAASLHTVEFDPVSRWYRRLHAADDHEVWLLSWLPGQGTGLHDHGESSGAFTVVAGTLHERSLIATPRGRGAARERLLVPGATRAFGQGYIHQVTNTGTEPAVSVHVYAPRLTAMTIFENDAGLLDRPGDRPLTQLRVERSGEDW